jgi:hypothetical protein
MSDPIQDFINRVKKLNKSNKDMRISYEEAVSLMIALAELLHRDSSLPKTVETTIQPNNRVIDGGTF